MDLSTLGRGTPAIPAVLVHYGQHFQSATILHSVHNEVIAPYVVLFPFAGPALFCTPVLADTKKAPSLALCGGFFESRNSTLQRAIHLLLVDPEALACLTSAHTLRVAVARVFLREEDRFLRQRPIPFGFPTEVALGRSGLANYPTRRCSGTLSFPYTCLVVVRLRTMLRRLPAYLLERM
jgi:hypothetical protein